ncbi:Alpha/beta superfamily hydrolase [Halorhabdus sp. SVX81]|uniref:alpha/beta hydrolase n=1 Tax=Halorhabdus sp. SVX81 TaxID=2978283 RepID=UPI0023DB8144|nr:alpha/beta hydrolase [Halorhabdus sp. SVX81]WEL18547.1 Alpha/beta superfamily hydrolase [Halorhabdus sp. SVX81]
MSQDVTLAVGDSTYPGRLNTPEEPSDRGILIVPGAGHGPFGDVFLRFARRAAEDGHYVARFETWISPNDLEAKTDEDFRAELAAGVEFLRSRGCSTITVVAKSFGGRVALEHLPDGVDRLVLWAPAVLAENAENVPEDAWDHLPAVTPGEFGVDVPTRILQGDDDGIPVDSAERIAEGLPDGELVVLPDEDHSFLRNYTRVIEETVAFLPE